MRLTVFIQYNEELLCGYEKSSFTLSNTDSQDDG